MVVIVLAIVANLAVAMADFARAPFVVANSAAVRVPLSWLPVLGAVKAAGALGLALGLVGVPVIGPLAAAGLVLFYVGAVVAHVRVQVYWTIAAPVAFLALSAACFGIAL